ncbi:T9SS sorting signal type C domain-containing protein [Flavobacterium foetidum]|uniref:T9SS sorting signal type C domain-containing protein n=1 Tax=Flavobacterium foetidum TaxID=2026681 RepID=UPI001074A004|nr:T9SS sorting signal type C domain-containing protein [Flavobacterium foetidum]KAF2516628.1 T9SS sorting signal type C domain-containing protein [Flavobacterium foetidum]
MKKRFSSALLLFTIYSVLLSNPSTVMGASNREGASQKLDNKSCENSTVPFEVRRHRVWINLTNTQGLFKQILIGYVVGATNGWDHNYDAVTMDANPYADFYSINEGKKLVIQGRALPFDPTDKIPLGYRSGITGDLTISIDHADGELNNRIIYLHDKETGIVHNLKNGGYTFSTLTGVFTDRFFISYGSSEKTLGIDDFENTPENLIISSKNRTINLISSQSDLREVYVFDITGKLLYSNSKVGKDKLEISSIQAENQILLVKTTLDNGQTINKKVSF